MSALLKWAAVPVVAFALAFAADAPQAEAYDGFRVQVGGLSIGAHSSHYGNYGHRGYSSHRIYNPGHHYGGYQSYRSYSRPHLDYHAPAIVPHRGHYDYVPGHFDVHRGKHHNHYRGSHRRHR
ncbi:hypothetical protein FF011L_08740 [Roseimaritima multifibrata]|uniref:Uncharacterized protein n=1 Tax=Roseimaritima multifibrata TaxID=1930274 RepID=A0A517MB74_9BACT|nr:hypothetical protein [Roseimaritima multifibrata]QDS92138.1 hypothetical protein FF011L_08740 [Roseimaritima multifibrata]